MLNTVVVNILITDCALRMEGLVQRDATREMTQGLAISRVRLRILIFLLGACDLLLLGTREFLRFHLLEELLDAPATHATILQLLHQSALVIACR